MTDHIDILKDLATNPANCRVLGRVEREALKAAAARMTTPQFDPEAVRALLAAAEPVSSVDQLSQTSMADWALGVLNAAEAVRKSEVKP